MTQNFIGRAGNKTALSRAEREEIITAFCELHNVNTDTFIQWLAQSNEDSFFKFSDTATRDLRNDAQLHYLQRYAKAAGISYDADMAQMTHILFVNRGESYADAPFCFGFEFTANMDALLMTFAEHLKLYAVLSAFDNTTMECADSNTLDALADLIEVRPVEHDVIEFGQAWMQFFVRYFAKPLWERKPQTSTHDGGSDSTGDMGMEYRP
jgi:hypothetical protein